MCGLLAYSGDGTQFKDFESTFKSITHRGPDDSEILIIGGGAATFGFHRLAIMDPTQRGHQPFKDDEFGHVIMCNGEVYNYEKLKEIYNKSHNFKSESDCEVLVPMYKELGIGRLCEQLDAEFALVIWDNDKKLLMAGRDPIGIRPLFFGFTAENKIMFASEAKALTPFCESVDAFPPGHFYDGEKHPRETY